MDKKDLFESLAVLEQIVNNMVKEIVGQHDIPEPMARDLVGFALLASIKSPAGAVSAN